MVLWAKLSEPSCVVSSDGRIFAVRRQHGTGKRKLSYSAAQFELPQYENNGYFRVRVDGVSIDVHRLVARAFLGETPKGMQIDHIDRNKHNNSLENLRFATRQEQNLNKDYVLAAQERLGGYKDKNEYQRKLLESKGFFKTVRNGKSVYLPIEERLFSTKRRNHEV